MTTPSVQLDWQFWTGSIVFFIAAVLSLLFSYAVWRLRARQSIGWYALACNGAMWMLYMLFGLPFDWHGGFVQRMQDGVEAPWIRGVTQAVVYLSFGMFVGAGSGTQANARRHILAAALIASVCLTLAEISHYAVSFVWWSGAVVALLVQHYLYWMRSKRLTWRETWYWAGSWWFTFGTPLVLALSWTMTQTLDTKPDREWSEFAYLLVNLPGVALYTLISIFVQMPPKTRAVLLDQPAPAEE
jgi:hypothetical protein